MKEIFVSQNIQSAVEELAAKIISAIDDRSNVCVVGICSKGIPLAARLSKLLSEAWGKEVPCGKIDITLYRDDITIRDVDGIPAVGVTELDFDINDKVVILVDDVLQTGRSCRAAMDAVVEFGRPSRMMLAVLIDRGGREFPIQADFIATNIEAPAADELLVVKFVETDGEDGIYLIKKQTGNIND
ncbi:MAG: bifunctional pyr operon transcriptional regulator/uracil phosphoribosyltransferase PyrR [Phycisphaerae bacterium]|jgi:pyrimidine operon attenuation protein/uracil phosphoribosyltransferase